MANIPRHVGIIMDGNGRWAKRRGLSRIYGHRVGFERSKKWLHFVFEQGVEVLTVFAFSTENWKRPKEEVNFLFSLFREAAREYFPKLVEENIRLRFIGDREGLPKEFQDLRGMMDALEMESAHNTEGIFVPAINYGGRDEILRAVKGIVASGFSEEDITGDLISQHLDTADLPDLDLVIRTSGEQRLSGFLPWQAVYAEYYFTSKYWPDFNKDDFSEALREYSTRKRKFGGTQNGS